MLAEKKSSIGKKIALGTVLVLIGVVIGALVVLALVGQSEQNEDQVRKNFIAKYTASEEARLGVDCKNLRGDLNAFLQKDIAPVLAARQPGKGWSEFVGDDLRIKTAKQRDYLFACGGLYLHGRRGEWNGLSDLGFSTELDKEMITMQTLIRFGEPKTKCDATCLDQNFNDLLDSFRRMEARVK